MNREETVVIIRAIKASYPTFKPDDLTETVNVWHMMLEDMDYKLISMALKSYIRSNNSSFAPSIGQLIDYAHKITAPEELTETQAWGLVIKAIRRSSYNSLEEFSKLPDNVQKAVGSPEQLRSMAIDPSFNENVASSNFMRSYKVILEREKEMRKVSPDVRTLVGEINEGSSKQLLEQKNAERVARLKSDRLIESKQEEYIAMPEEVKEKMKEILGRS